VAGRFTSFNGFTHNRVCRLNANGSVDQTFGLGNGINNAALALALQSDGRIIVGGQFSQIDLTQLFNLARLNTNGSVDLSFDPGNGPNGDVNAIVIQPDGRIIIGGTFIGTMVLPVGEWRAFLEMARSILHSIPVSELVETFSRWHCNITARSFWAVALSSTQGPIAPLLRAFSGTARSISDSILCPTIGFNRLRSNPTIAFLSAASSPA
jgi:hypothetical protein